MNEGYSRSHRRALDFSRVRAQTSGFPRNFLSYATVGHSDTTPAYVRVEDGDVLIECTLVPAGDEIVARLDLDTTDGGADYFPVSYGQRLIVGFPGGEQGDPVILGRCSDKSWPFPDEVAGVRTNPGLPSPAVNPAPAFAFRKTQDGQLLAFESGDGADVLMHSGGSYQAKVAPAEQVLLTGRTHIGSIADFTIAPIGASIGPDGFVTPGAQGAPYIPVPNTNTRLASAIPYAPVPVPPPPAPPVPQLTAEAVPIPADGIVRMKDTVQSNATNDPIFWSYVALVDTLLRAVATLDPVEIAPALTALETSFPIPPTFLNGQPVTASLNTCGDD